MNLPLTSWYPAGVCIQELAATIQKEEITDPRPRGRGQKWTNAYLCQPKSMIPRNPPPGRKRSGLQMPAEEKARWRRLEKNGRNWSRIQIPGRPLTRRRPRNDGEDLHPETINAQVDLLACPQPQKFYDHEIDGEPIVSTGKRM